MSFYSLKTLKGFPIYFQWSYISLKYFPLRAPILFFFFFFWHFICLLNWVLRLLCVFLVILRNSQNYFFKIFLPYLDFSFFSEISTLWFFCPNQYFCCISICYPIFFLQDLVLNSSILICSFYPFYYQSLFYLLFWAHHGFQDLSPQLRESNLCPPAMKHTVLTTRLPGIL